MDDRTIATNCSTETMNRRDLFLMSSAISLQNVTVHYNGNLVLDHLSLSVQQGEFLGIIGPNGAGKTTLFRVLLGLIQPSKGSVTLTDQQGNILPFSSIGYVPQSRLIDPETPIRVRDFISLGLPHRFRPWLTSADKERVEEAMLLTGSLHLAEKSIGKLSGGEKQRVFLAQALVRDPQVLLLDEPTSNLDPGAQEAMASVVHTISRKKNMSVLFISHDINLIANVADRILYLTKGHYAIGTIEEVIRPEVLTKLYGTKVQVTHSGSKLVVATSTNEFGSTICYHGNGNA